MRLEVRCCCKVRMVLGTLEVPDTYVVAGAGHYPFTLIKKITTHEAMLSLYSDITPVPCERVTVELRRFRDDDGRVSLAVYSDDHPIEFWRKFGDRFIEATPHA
jgi:hypothetical protein